jgi:hypothetical protein
VAPQLHQAFANHQHIYNLDQHRVEDVHGCQLSTPCAQRERTPLISAVALRTSEGYGPSECLLSNSVLHVIGKDDPRICALRLLEVERIAFFHVAVHAATNVLKFAPKTSPPSLS